jgi:hypothetical protein
MKNFDVSSGVTSSRLLVRGKLVPAVSRARLDYNNPLTASRKCQEIIDLTLIFIYVLAYEPTKRYRKGPNDDAQPSMPRRGL